MEHQHLELGEQGAEQVADRKPKVDGNVFVRAEEELISGDIVPVRITGANEYDLMGDVIYADEFTE